MGNVINILKYVECSVSFIIPDEEGKVCFKNAGGQMQRGFVFCIFYFYFSVCFLGLCIGKIINNIKLKYKQDLDGDWPRLSATRGLFAVD